MTLNFKDFDPDSKHFSFGGVSNPSLCKLSAGSQGGGHDFMDYKFVGSLDFIRFKIQPNNINL